MSEQTEFGATDPFWVDKTWLDTVVVFGLSCFVLCLMNLSKVSLKVSVREFSGYVGGSVHVAFEHANIDFSS
jgi:hypothetical protein